MKFGALILFGSFYTTMCGNLVQLGAFPQPYQQKIDGINYGSNAAACYNTCYRGQTCTSNHRFATCKAYCGDGIVVGVETGANRCDDGNNVDRDGCTNCIVDNLYTCQNQPSLCTTICGNGVLDLNAKQQCDDGNLKPADGCSSICVVNPGWTCTANDGQLSVCEPLCGDGKLIGDQTNPRKCDDGNIIPLDGCDSTCNAEDLYLCTLSSVIKSSVCDYVCGNGKLNQAANQICDDGNQINGDGCSNKCQVQTGFTCNNKTGALSRCRRNK